MNSVRASINCSAEIPLSKASPSQRWKVSIWAFIPQTVNSSRGQRMDFAVDRAGWGERCLRTVLKGIHCAPPIRLNYRIKKPAFAGFILFVVRDYRRDGVILA